MPAPKATTEPKKSMIAALTIFIVLFLAAAVMAVVFYMKNEQYVKAADDAINDLAVIANPSQIRTIEPLAKKSGTRVSKTAVGQITEDMREMATLIGGKDMSEFNLVGARDLVNTRAAPLWDKLKEVLPDPTLGQREQGLIRIINTLIALNKDLQDKNLQAEFNMVTLEEQHENEKKTQDELIARLTQELAAATQSAQVNSENYTGLESELTGRYEEIINSRNTDITKLQEQLKQLQEENNKLTTEMVKSRAEIKQLNDRLQQFQPKPPTDEAALEVDGEVILVESRKKLAYINLNQNDHIYRGLTFTVYDRFQPIPRSGQGKGALEVIEIMENISKCRITDFDPTNPIMEKDLIANLVWSKDKKYRFCVIGDFDLNGDGRADPDEQEQINKLIEHWGGQVMTTFSVDTDFMVVGRQPQTPVRPADEYIDTDAAVARQYRQALQRVENYVNIRAEGAALGVPTFNLSRFLYFIGYYKQAKNL